MLTIPGEAVADFVPPSEQEIRAGSQAFADWFLAQRDQPEWRWEALLCSDPESDDPDVLLGRIVDAEGLLTQLEALQAEAMARLRGLRLAEQQRVHGQRPPPGALDEDGWVASEVGFTLGLSEAQVRRRMDYAAGLSRHAGARGLVQRGGLPSWTAHKLVEHLDELATLVSPRRLAALEEATIAWLSQRPRTVSALNARMRRLILRARADAGLGNDDTAGRAHADRQVGISSTGDGCATLWACLPEVDALAVAAALDAAVPRVADDPHDPRTRAQRRADALVARLTGAPSVYGLASDVPVGRNGEPVRARIEVSVPLATLTGKSAAAGEVPGYGPIPASTVHDLAGDPGPSMSGLLYDAQTGQLLGLAPGVQVHIPSVLWADQVGAATGYGHTAAQQRTLRARDVRCRAPGCARPARLCDCDHVEPWPAGATSVENGCSLCRFHHRLKTHAPRWSVTVSGDADLVWRSPTGRTVTTQPHDYRDPGDDPPQSAGG
jgi:hypothetical protein